MVQMTGSHALFQKSLLLTSPIALGLSGAFVVVLFALGDAQSYFDPANMVKIHYQRNKGHALALGGVP